jgi:hypothetical protein
MRAFTGGRLAATLATILDAVVMLDPRQAERLERRAAAKRARIRRERRVGGAVAAAVAALIVIAILIATAGGDKPAAHRTTPARAARTRPKSPRVIPTDGGPIAPAAYGGLAALWAPQNVVGDQPGTAAAYGRASRLAGLPGYLLIADRGNNRILVVNPQRHVVFQYPSGADLAAGRRLFYNDDTFVEPGGRALIANEEDNHAIVQVGLAAHSLKVLFGHPGQVGAGATHLNTPDDAYALPDGSFTVADAYNCRILFVRGGKIVRQLGKAGACHHDPPAAFGPVNGDTPEPGGGVMVSEIPGSWIDGISATGAVQFAFRAPIAYPSDPQPLPGGRILLADYSSPGHVLIMNRAGRVLWRYGPTHGPGRMDHPSLAMALPNGDIAVNDDFRDRVIVVNPRTRRIVWQYGHTDVGGTAPGYLHIPDGMDFIPPNANAGAGGGPDYAAVVHP